MSAMRRYLVAVLVATLELSPAAAANAQHALDPSPPSQASQDHASGSIDSELGRSLEGSFSADSRPRLPDVEPPNERPLKPRHTGFQALVRTTAADFIAFPRRRSTYVILGIGAMAAGLALPVDDEVTSHLRNSTTGTFFAPGRVIGYGWVHAGAAAATYLVGRYAIKPPEGKTNKVSHLGFDLVRANIVTQALTFGVKLAFRRDRPTGECCSFPSGHAAVTFASASVLERHLGGRATWPTFAVGTYVALSRVFDQRHFLSDVLFGSALGIASGWTIVGRHSRDDYALVPVPVPGGMAVALAWHPSSHARSHAWRPADRRGPAKAQIESRENEQVQQRRRDETAHDDDGQRVLDFVAGPGAADDDRHERQSRCERGHENRRQPLFRSPDDEIASECHSLLRLQVPVVTHEHDAVPGGNANHGDQPDERAK
jgi:membrane-associated phospholipid phosphatase